MRQALRRIFINHKFLQGFYLIELLVLVIAISVFALILLNRSGNFLRVASITLRTGFNLSVLLCLMILYITFRLKGWLGRFSSLVFTVALFAFGLAGLWAIGQTQPTILMGILPLFDASDYYSDALRLLAGQDFSVFAARRPLFPGLLAFVLWASSHNLMVALSIFTLITALACFAAAREIHRTHGAEVAFFVLAILFLYYRYHSGLVMSENLGLALGTLGFAFLWRGTADHSKLLVWFGLLVVTLALNARAGTFFMLPLLVFWFGWVFRSPDRKFSWSYLALASSAVLLGFVANMIMFRLLASPSGVPFANFSYTLYGLAAGGKTWRYVFEVRPDLYLLQEPYHSREIYRMAFDLILHQPALLIKGALYSWAMLFSNSWYSAYSYVAGENPIIGQLAQWGLFVLCALGIVRWARKPEDILNGLVCIAALGVFLSVPFLPPTDAYRMRPYAVSIIIFGLLPAMGLLFVIEKLKIPFVEKGDTRISYLPILSGLTVLLLFSSLIAPVLLKNVGKLPSFQAAACDGDMELVSIRFDPGTHFNVIRQRAPGLDWLPNFHVGRFRRNSHSMADPNMIAWTDTVEPGESVFYSLDFRSMEKVLIVTPTDHLPEPGSYWQVCGDWETDPVLDTYNIFYARMEARIDED